MRDDDDVRETPPAVVGAVSAGTVPLPFLAVYSVVFLVHGSVHPVLPPDVTSTKHGEFAVGCVTLVAFILTSVTLLWFLNGRRRWPYAIVQLAILGAAFDFFLDVTKGGPVVSLLVIIGSVISLVLGFAPQSWRHVDRPVPHLIATVYGWVSRRSAARADATALPGSAEPTAVEPASLRRRRPGPRSSSAPSASSDDATASR